MKRILTIGLIISILFSCTNSAWKSNELLTEVKENGDSLIYQIDKIGLRSGAFKAFYNDGCFANGFFKDGFRDSLYELFYPEGSIKARTTYVKGLLEGFYYKHDPKDINYKSVYFIRHDKVKTIGERKKINDSIELVLYYNYENDKLIYTGKLSYHQDTLIESASSYFYYHHNNKINDLIYTPLGKKATIEIHFFPLFEGSEVKAIIDSNVHEQGFKSPVYDFKINKINHQYIVDFKLEFVPKIKGWNFVSGQIIETDKTKGEKSTPFYFNYFVF